MQVTRLYTILLVSLFLSATADSLTAQTITHVPLYTFHGSRYQFGFSVSGAGDVNGDGTPDVIVGASTDPFIGGSVGSAHVYSGSDGSELYEFGGVDPNLSFGGSVSDAGDVNGDGTPDLIVGAYGAGTGNGSAYVFSGSDGSVLYRFEGDSEFDSFGRSVSGAGDVNGDGMADLIVGANGDDNNGISSGSARVLSGSDGSILYNFDGDNEFDLFGRSVSGVGDINGDGTPDLIVGAYNDGNNGINTNGRGSVSVISGSDGSVLYKFDGTDIGDRFGWSVSGAGDVNGDGTPDLIVGAQTDGNNGVGSGSARVLSGSDGSVLYNFDGDSASDFFGSSVSGAGDVNGDGFADLIVGAFLDDNNGFKTGSARVLSGSDGSVLYQFDGDNDTDEFGVSVSGAGDINGDGFDDFIVGAWVGGYARVFVSQISVLPGDVNQDGVVDFLDIGPLISILAAADYLAEADIDQNGVVDFLDIQHFIALLSS